MGELSPDWAAPGEFDEAMPSGVVGGTECAANLSRLKEAAPLLLEVNSSPGLRGGEEATGKDVAGATIVSLERQLGWERPLAPLQSA